MRYASPRVVLFVTALMSIRPVSDALGGSLTPDAAALRVMESLAVAWVLVGILTGVSHSFLTHRDRDRPEDGPL
jgi:hypothetical protein